MNARPHTDPAVQEEQRTQTQLALGAMLIPLFFVILFAVCIIGTAAFVPTADPKQPATVIVTAGGGRLVAVAAETLARSVTAAQGASS